MHELLLSLNIKGKPKHGFINEIANKYNVHRKTVGRMWRQIRDQKNNDQVPITVNTKRKGSKGKPSIPFDEKKFKSIEIENIEKSNLKDLCPRSCLCVPLQDQSFLAKVR